MSEQKLLRKRNLYSGSETVLAKLPYHKYSNLSIEYSKFGGDSLGFPENLARLQAERGETNYRLAMAIGVHQTSIKNWKCGTSKPQYRHLSAIAEHFGISVADLLKEKQETAHAASGLSEVERGKTKK